MTLDILLEETFDGATDHFLIGKDSGHEQSWSSLSLSGTPTDLYPTHPEWLNSSAAYFAPGASSAPVNIESLFGHGPGGDVSYVSLTSTPTDWTVQFYGTFDSQRAGGVPEPTSLLLSAMLVGFAILKRWTRRGVA